MTKISSKELWKALEAYHKQGLSAIWARAEAEGEKTAKSPWGRWRAAQQHQFSLDKLGKDMDKATVRLGIGTVCGKVSGFLEVIDIDPKHWAEIALKFMSELKSARPELYARLRIHKTPSGGYHLLYLCPEGIEGNKKLAYKADVKDAGIETRGEGGFIVLPPTVIYTPEAPKGLTYTIVQDVPIPTITKEERDFIIFTAKLFNEKTTVKRERKPSKKMEEMYDESPWHHFNNSLEGSQILENHGWAFSYDSDQFIHYTRPEKKKGVSASYNRNKRLYRIFTSSTTTLEGSTTYTPSWLLTLIQFDGDGTKAYRYLVDKGFGKVRKNYETKMVPRLVQAGREVPKNFSQAAKDQHLEEATDLQQRYPYGVYWEATADLELFKISRVMMQNVMEGLGFRLLEGDIIQLDDIYYTVLHDERDVYDVVYSYVQEEDADFYKMIVDTFDAFWERHHKHMITRLPKVPTNKVLFSDYLHCYKVFRNCVLDITAKKIGIIDDDRTIGKLINRDTVIDRDYVHEAEWDKTKYLRYLRKGVRMEEDDLMQVIGYLCYDYRDQRQGWVIALTEEMDAEDGGGTGKGVFTQMLALWTTVYDLDMDGTYRKKEELLQGWNGEKVIHLDDIPKKMNFSMLKAMSTGATQVKKLYKDVRTVPLERMPKIVTSGQWSADIFSDGGIKRRLFMVPFNGYFNRGWSVEDEFGGYVPRVWDEADWDGYYRFVAECVHVFMSEGCRLDTDVTLKGSVWQKAFDQKYSFSSGDLRDWIDMNIGDWIQETVTNGGLPQKEFADRYHSYCDQQNIKMQMTTQGIKKALKYYCEMHGYKLEENRIRPDGGLNPVRGLSFSRVSEGEEGVKGGELFAESENEKTGVRNTQLADDERGYPSSWDDSRSENDKKSEKSEKRPKSGNEKPWAGIEDLPF